MELTLATLERVERGALKINLDKTLATENKRDLRALDAYKTWAGTIYCKRNTDAINERIKELQQW
jgi:hypothetical protein